MKETEILTTIAFLLQKELSQQDISITVKYNVQPNVTDKDPTIYLMTSSLVHKGFPKCRDQITATEIEHLEGQLYESTINITGQVLRDTSLELNSLPITSLELTNKVAHCLQSDRVRLTLKEKGISVMKINEVNQSFHSDDGAKDQTFASFKFIVCHEEVSKTTSPITQSFELKKYRI